MQFKKTTLKSGLRIMTIPVKGAPAVSVTVIVETGSNYESKAENGLSHFLEHMFFKGTERRPTSRIISHELDSIGASSNAFTSRECTGYWAKSHPKKLDQILDIVSDIYLNSTLDSKEIEKERGVILEEINMYNDSPRSLVGKNFIELMYGNQPAGRDILGTPENVKKFKRRDFEKYRAKHYVASSTLVVVAGNFDEKQVIKKVEKIFRGMSVGTKARKQKVMDSQAQPRVHIRSKKSDQVHMVLGFRTFAPGGKDDYSLSVLTSILGRGMSSRLFLKIREDLGAAYYVGAGLRVHTDHGSLNISAGLAQKKYRLVLSEILKECAALKQELVSEEELEKAKEYVIGNMFLHLETSDSIADFYAEQEVLGLKIATPEEESKRIRQVTAKDVRRVAKKVFRSSRLNLATVGNLRSTYSLREMAREAGI